MILFYRQIIIWFINEHYRVFTDGVLRRCTSLRVRYDNECEAEFGYVEPSWIKLPLDMGTQTVLRVGYKVVIDKNNYFKNIKV